MGRSRRTSRGPWAGSPTTRAKRKVFAAHILETKPNAKIGVLFQNDDYGKDYLKGFEDGLGDKAKTMIVSKVTYEVTDPTVDSQMVTLKSSGADTFFNITTPKFAAQAIKKAAEIGWKPTHYLNSVSASVGSVMTPAGLENGVGIYHRQLHQGPDRSAVPERQGAGTTEGVDARVQRQRRPQRRPATSTATRWRRAWCRCSSRPATT